MSPKTRTRKRIFRAIGALMLLTAMGSGGWLIANFYYVFENSNTYFRWQYHLLPQLAFYTGKYTYTVGESIDCHISGNGAADLRLWDVHKTQVFQAKKIQLGYQPLPDSASVRGCGWRISTQLATASLPSGWYIVEVAQGARSWRQTVFIVPQRVQKRVAMLLCTHTWNAYNAWGGQSLYTKNYAHTVSFLRPQPLSDPFLPDNFTNQQYRYQSARQDRHLAALFTQHHIAYDAYDIGALENNIEQLKKYDIITISTHSEYWTENMLRHLNEYLAQGGSLLSLSGNTAAYISYLNTQNHTLSVYKSEANLWCFLELTSDFIRFL